MARVICGITVVTLQFLDILHRAHDAGNDELVQGHSLHIETVVERLPNVLQQQGSTGHKVRDGAVEFVDMIVRTLANIHQFLLAGLSILAVFDRTDTPLVGSHNLHALTIGESRLVVRNGENAVVFFSGER